MRVYLSFDIEGISGITDPRDIDVHAADFIRARQYATHDVNAAVEGALAAGATDVVVNDGHGRERRNLIYEQLHPRARLLRGRNTTAGLNMAAFDRHYDAVFFVGWHARPAAPGVLSHCLRSEAFTEWRINGLPVGEAEIAAAYAGQQGVPLVLFTGDDCACREVRCWCPDCEFVVTKQAVDRLSAICLSLEETYQLIRQGAERALRRRSEIRPFRFDRPVRVEASVVSDHVARAIALMPGVEQTGLLTVAFESGDYEEVFRCIQAMSLISRTATGP